MNKKVKITSDYEYVVDTSIIRATTINYAHEMNRKNPQSEEDYHNIHKTCFELLLELYDAKIALDSGNRMKSEYDSIVFNEYPSDFPAQWFMTMESQGKIIIKNIQINGQHKTKMHKEFGLSKTDCCLVHVAEKTNSRRILHREKGLLKAAGYIKKYFNVEQIHVMKHS